MDSLNAEAATNFDVSTMNPSVPKLKTYIEMPLWLNSTQVVDSSRTGNLAFL